MRNQVRTPLLLTTIGPNSSTNETAVPPTVICVIDPDPDVPSELGSNNGVRASGAGCVVVVDCESSFEDIQEVCSAGVVLVKSNRARCGLSVWSLEILKTRLPTRVLRLCTSWGD